MEEFNFDSFVDDQFEMAGERDDTADRAAEEFLLGRRQSMPAYMASRRKTSTRRIEKTY